MELREPIEVTIPPHGLGGHFVPPETGAGVVVFAHGSGSSRHSPRNRFVAEALRQAGLGTLLFDLLRPEEAEDPRKVFDIPLLAERLMNATDWLTSPAGAGGAVPVGYFGASTGAAAALAAAALHPDPVRAVVSRGGRPDLAGAEALSHVRAPTLLIVGGLDEEVLALNRAAAARMPGEVEVRVVEGAGHLFEEAGTLDAVVVLARDWFEARIGRGRGLP
jgi:pimeloyl-ACP methyl ester carboxylesterase